MRVRVPGQRRFSTILAAALVCGTFLTAAPPRQEAQTSRLAGTVIDAVSKAPIAGARVTASREGTEPAGSATTDPRGEFVLSGLPAGSYQLRVFHADYLPETGFQSTVPPRRFEVRPAQAVTDVVVRLPRRPIVSGTVRDERGEPVVNVEVVALRRTPGSSDAESDRTGTTDDRGVYRLLLSGLASEYLVLVRGSGLGRLVPGQPRMQTSLSYPTTYYPAATRPSAAIPVAVGPNEERGGIDVTLTPSRGATVAAQLTGGSDASGLIDVFLLPVDGSDVQWNSPAGTVRVAHGARFSFTNVPRGRHLLWAVTFPRHTGRPTPTIRWSGPGSFSGSGRMFGPDATPLLSPPDGDTLWARHIIDVESDDLELTIPLGPGSKVSGRVVFDGVSPVPSQDALTRIPIVVYPADGASLGSIPMSGVEADRTFRIVSLPPGAYQFVPFVGLPLWQIRSIEADGRDVTRRPVQVGSNDITDLVFTFSDRKTTITGVLRDASGRLLERRSVVVFPVDQTLWQPRLLLSPIVFATSGANGTFDATVAGAGEYFVAGVPVALQARVQDPQVLDQLSRAARAVRVAEGQRTTVDVTMIGEP